MQDPRPPAVTPVLFLHGGGVSSWMWEPLTLLLPQHITPILYDLPGHGSRTRETFRDHSTVTHELATFIRSQHPDGIHVVGFSLGAQLAISLASEFPELVTSVVVVSGESVPAPMPRATLCLLKWALPLARFTWFARAQANALSVPPELLDDYVEDSRNITSETLLNSVGENIRFTLPVCWRSYPSPVHILVGENERGLMLTSAAATHAAATNSTLTRVSGSAHDIPFTNPQVLEEILTAVASPAR